MSIRELAVVRTARHECGAFLKWWIQELRELAEAVLERVAPRLARRLVIQFGDRVATASAPRGGQRAMSFQFERDERGEWPTRLEGFPGIEDYRGGRVTLILAPGEVFKSDLVLPEVPERDLKPMIELHLEREWPVSRDQFAVDYWIVESLRSKASLKIQVLVARQEHLDRLRELVQGWGLRPQRIGTAAGSSEIVGDFLPRRFRLRTIKSVALAPLERKLATAAAVLILTLGVVIAGQWIYERVVVGAALANVSRRATVAARLAHELAQESLPARELLRISATPDAVDVLEALSRSVPTTAWVYELNISAPSASTSNVRLAAFAPSASALVDVLQQTHQFGTVRLDWAMSNVTRSGLDQLQLTASSSKPRDVWDASNGGLP